MKTHGFLREIPGFSIRYSVYTFSECRIKQVSGGCETVNEGDRAKIPMMNQVAEHQSLSSPIGLALLKPFKPP